jgi:hypothetical protein
MKVAKSIYLGGNLVEAKTADYTSSKNLGLVCPFCQNAVFWRQSYIRGELKISASFVHYKAKMGDTCELRSMTKEGKQQLEQLEIESRNQRLALFQNHLWELILKGNEIEDYQLKSVNKFIPTQLFEFHGKKIQKLWKSNYLKFDIEWVYQKMVEFYQTLYKKSKGQFQDKHAIASFDMSFNQKIIKEIFAFLASYSGNRVLSKLLKLVLFMTLNENPILSNKKSTEIIKGIKSSKTDVFLLMIQMNIIGINWREILYSTSDLDSYATNEQTNKAS